MSKRPKNTTTPKDAATLARLLAQSPGSQELRREIAETSPKGVGSAESIPSMSKRIKGAFSSGSLPMATRLRKGRDIDVEVGIQRSSQTKTEKLPNLETAGGQLAPASSLNAMRDIRTAADLGQMVKKAREDSGMTQQEFADLAGVGRRFVSELENGKPTIEIGKALKVAHGAGISLHGRQR